MLYCQLPHAFRRLTRPSSPVFAKASTTSTWSLDPITLYPSNFFKRFRVIAFHKHTIFKRFQNAFCKAFQNPHFFLIVKEQVKNKIKSFFFAAPLFLILLFLQFAIFKKKIALTVDFYQKRLCFVFLRSTKDFGGG